MVESETPKAKRTIPSFRESKQRGEKLTKMLLPVLGAEPYWESLSQGADGTLTGILKPPPELFAEEERSKQPSAFSVLRTLTRELGSPKDGRLGLVGAFGYDLLFQFDPIRLKLPREGQTDLHLFLCDDIWFMDRKKEQIERYRCEPYVYSQMTAGRDAPTPGEAKNSWLTGTAAWTFVAASQYILGVTPTLEGLRVDPCIPSHWRDCKVQRRYRGRTYRIEVRNPQGRSKGARLTVDGHALDGNVIPPDVGGDVVDVVAEL